MRGQIASLVAAALLTAGCERPWQAARTVVTATAGAVAAADVAVEAHYEASPCEGTQDVAELEACVARLAAAVEALQAAREAALAGEAIVDTWERLALEPDAWPPWLLSIGAALAHLVALLEAAGVDVPDEVTDLAALVAGLIGGGR